MKRKQLFALLLVIALAAVSTGAAASFTDEAGFSYEVLGGTKAAVIGYSGGESEVTIPGMCIDGTNSYAVTAIGVGAFKGNTALRSVKFPDILESIGENAFSGCVSLEETKEYEWKDIKVSKVKLNKVRAKVEVGQTLKLLATVRPTDAINKIVKWTSSDETVATVNKGVVTGVKEGTAFIVATTVDGNKTATCTVTIVPEGQGEVVIPAVVDTIAIPVGGGAQLPKYQGMVVNWAVADPSVASITGTKVKGLKEGETTLYLHAVSGSKALTIADHTLRAGETQELTLHVQQASDLVKKIMLQKAQKKLTLNMTTRSSAVLMPQLNPPTAKDTKLFYSSSNTGVAEVDDEGNVFAVGPGTATITIYSTSLKTAKVKVTVEGQVRNMKMIDPVTGKAAKKLKMAPGDKKELKLVFNEDAYETGVNITNYWKDATDVSVDESSGIVTVEAKNPGKSVILFQAIDGSGKQVKLTVVVK